MKGCLPITLVVACAHAASMWDPDLATEGSFQDAMETSIVNLATSEDDMLQEIPTLEELEHQNAKAMARIRDMLEAARAGKAMRVESETEERSSVKQVQRQAKTRGALEQEMKVREQVTQRNNEIKAKFRAMIKKIQEKQMARKKQKAESKVLVVTADKSDKNVFHMPVKRQIPTEEMHKFVKTLSPGCGEMFRLMQAGEGNLHTFGSAKGVPANAQGCEKLGGKMCFTDASISKSGNGGAMMRKMMSTTSTSGNSCLPRKCLSTDDLTNVANFMRGQALTIIPGDAHKIKLHVDCTESGGDSVTVGSSYSGSAVAAPTTMVLAAVLAVSQFAFMAW